MNSSWKRRASEAAFAATFAVAALFASAPPAEAAGCPTTPVSEHGGSHWCFSDGARGNVHLWKPGSYRESDAVTVVYMHGYNNDEMSGKPAKRLESGSYIDRAWDKHKLAQQFSASGLNALFIAAEGPIGNKGQINDDRRYATEIWTSLDALLSAVQDKGKTIPPSSVTGIGHSAGMFTIDNFYGDNRLKHVIALDSMYGDDGGRLREAWLKRSSSNKLTLVGGTGTGDGAQNPLMKALSDRISCATGSGKPSQLTAEQIAAPCFYLDSNTGHMAIVTGAQIIPVMLSRSGPAAAGSGGSSGGVSPTASTGTARPLQDATLAAPSLEIPIPGLEFSDAIRTNGEVTIPWLAQYIGGVYAFLLSIVGVMAAVMMVVGGFQYVTSAGDKGRIGAAKKRIVNALTGLILALGSYTILFAINPDLVAFEGLKVAGVQTELYETTAEQAHDEGDVYPDSAAPTGGSGTLPASLCKDVPSCRKYCQEAGCKATLKCAVNPKTNAEECKANVTCDKSKFPQSAPGIIAASQAVNAQKAFAGKPGIRAAQAGDLVSIQVRDGLIRAGALADREGYEIVMTDGFRTLPTQFDLVCERIVKADYWRPTKPDVANTLVEGIGSAVAWPGGSLHGAGYAADIQLHKKGGGELVCSGCCGSQGNAQYKEHSHVFDRIMTEAGARRYSNEIWHYEFGAPASVQPRCTFPNCPWPPSCKKKQSSG